MNGSMIINARQFHSRDLWLLDKMTVITTRLVCEDELPEVITFDNRYFQTIMIEEMNIPADEVPPALTYQELKESHAKGDDIEWIYVNNELAGYFWFEYKVDCLFISGLAIKENFYSVGICEYVLGLVAEKAKKNNVTLCRLACLPLNGRAINAYLKDGYRIVQCTPRPYRPEKDRFILEKNLVGCVSESDSIDTHEIECSDTVQLKSATDNGYVGVSLVRGSSNLKNKIIFKKLPE